MVIHEQLAGMHLRHSSAGASQPELFESFEQVESNREACKQANAFVDGRVRNLAIHGARGWGKSHLTQSIANAIGLPVVDVREKSLCRLPDSSILLIDDADACKNRPKRCQEIRLELERRVKSRRRTLVVLNGNERTARAFLPSPRSWKNVRMDEPSDAERAAIVRRMCANEGLELSQTSVGLVARLVRGDGHSLSGALSRLKVGRPSCTPYA
jgi:chromosomal replication initiation ATPase DnaA